VTTNPKTGVAQELEALVGLTAGVLGTPRPVGQRLGEQLLVSYLPAQPGRKTGPLAGRLVPDHIGPVSTGASGSGPYLGNHVIDGVAHCFQVFQILVVDPETGEPPPEILFQGFNQLDESQRIGPQVTERSALGYVVRTAL